MIAANRFGLGAKPGELSTIGKNPRHWLLDQLAGPSRVTQAIADIPPTAKILVEVQRLRQMRRDAKKAETEEVAPDVVKQFRSVARKHYLQQTEARFQNAAATQFPFHDRLVHFWSNHFAISVDKQPVSALAGAFENEAIRPNLSGSFYQLLKSVEQHPAMIIYLDNQRSVGPSSVLGRRAAKRRNRQQEVGLNENLGREILELHTLGVNAGYNQDDVTALARVITGWSIGGAGERGRFAEGTPGKFEFRENIHEPGARTILGNTYRQKGLKQGEAVLQDLALNPATAQHISFKLVRHFVADNPSDDVVNSVARQYLESGGDLPTMHRAIVEAHEAWTDAHCKYKSPEDFVVSAFRAFDRVPDNGRYVVGALDLMGQTPFRPGSPAGWPDTAEHWGGADALYKRIEWANAVAKLAGPKSNPLLVGDAVLGPALGQHSRTAISRAESSVQGLTLFLTCPEFQRR